MRKILTTVLVSLVVFLLAVPSLRAQDLWAKVEEVPSGTQIAITTLLGSRLDGKLKASTEEQLVVVTKGGSERRIPRADIQTVSASRSDPVWNGLLVGAAIGFGGGSAYGAALFCCSGRYGAKPPGYAAEFIPMVGVVGSVLGALVGWRMDKARVRTEVIYKAPSVP